MKKTLVVVFQLLSLSSTVFAADLALQDMNCEQLGQVAVARRAQATELAKEAQLMTRMKPGSAGAALQNLAIDKIVEADQIETLFKAKCLENK